ncbi:uncharacterized protein BCR38DRAFT_94019 [Pseudomassariella vexata]|uniref:Zn(2)-C6 fungal-type domain-containing protein n=1 Tax=Pseudomassariella vexata TaxID=1141098 RepID=A0A1Y2EE52_9PEZI|nr:uncharacterized protein BCR38DRAFT_94019 [Pseudomassariella vexata]ORY69849.1 hypothetical protein BCR38DRAFT_94019 [Pseudomassariella vexata]
MDVVSRQRSLHLYNLPSFQVLGLFRAACTRVTGNARHPLNPEHTRSGQTLYAPVVVPVGGMADSPVTLPVQQPGPGRIKRNTACNTCRDAKVRCNPSLQPNQPCQRCVKLGLDCVVDKTHKRISRKRQVLAWSRQFEISYLAGMLHPAHLTCI